jgi:hypothetical protein
VDAEQRIRTAASIPVEAVIVDRVDAPVYLRIADKAKHLRQLGMSDRAIARALRVSDKTAAKAAGTPERSPRGHPTRRMIVIERVPLRLPSKDAASARGARMPAPRRSATARITAGLGERSAAAGVVSSVPVVHERSLRTQSARDRSGSAESRPGGSAAALVRLEVDVAPAFPSSPIWLRRASDRELCTSSVVRGGTRPMQTDKSAMCGVGRKDHRRQPSCLTPA